MAITSIGYDGPITEPGMASLLPNSGSAIYGVVGAGDWKVTAHPSTAQAVNIAVGQGWGPAVIDTTDSIVTVQCDPISSGTRWDLIAVHRDWTPPGGATSFIKINGTSTKQLPARDNNPGVKDDQPLALVQWTAGQTQPTAVVDLRLWPSGGGMVAKDMMVQSFLNRVGTTVTIGTEEWQCTLGDNDISQWTRVSVYQRIPVFGVGPVHTGSIGPNPLYFYMQAGSTIITADPNGNGSVTFPKAFPNGLLSAIPTNGDKNATGNGWIVSSSSTTTGMSVNLSNGSGAGFKNQWRCDWVAWGF